MLHDNCRMNQILWPLATHYADSVLAGYNTPFYAPSTWSTSRSGTATLQTTPPNLKFRLLYCLHVIERMKWRLKNKFAVLGSWSLPRSFDRRWILLPYLKRRLSLPILLTPTFLKPNFFFWLTTSCKIHSPYNLYSLGLTLIFPSFCSRVLMCLTE